jgi:hypothetical protein
MSREDITIFTLLYYVVSNLPIILLAVAIFYFIQFIGKYKDITIKFKKAKIGKTINQHKKNKEKQYLNRLEKNINIKKDK